MVKPILFHHTNSISARPETAVRRAPLSVRPVRLSLSSIAPIRSAEIKRVDPSTLAPASIEPLAANPAPAAGSKKSSVRSEAAFAAAAAFTAAFLAPALSYASGLTVFAGGLGPVGYALAGTGLFLSVRLLWKKYQELKPQNYQSPRSALVTNNPTPRKLLKTMVAPAFALALGAGAVMTYAPFVSQAIGLSSGSLTWGAFGLLLSYCALKITVSSVRDIARQIEFRRKGIQRNVVQQELIPQLLTNAFGNLGWLSQVVLMAHFSKIYFTQFIGMAFNLTHNVFNLAGNLLPSAEFGLAVGTAALAYHLLIGARKTRVGRPLEKQPSLLQSSLKVALAGVAVGTAIYLSNPWLVATNLIVFAVTLSFAHGAIHSTRSQEGGLRQKDKIFPVFDLQSTWEGVRGPRGAFRTVYKPAVEMTDPLTSAYIMVLITEGANWVLNCISGCYTSADYEKAQQMIGKLLNPDAKAMREILKAGHKKVLAAKSQQEALNAVAAAFEQTARFLDEAAQGDLKTRSGLDFLRDGTFSAGLPGSKARRSDQDLRVHGEHIRFAARLYEEAARRFRNMGEADAAKLSLDSLKQNITEKLEALHRRAFPHSDTHPGRFYTNFLPDSYTAKQFVIDLCAQVMADFVGAMEVVVLNPQGQVEIWLVPLKAVKDVAPNYREVSTLEAGNDEKEDPRFGWYVRDDHDIGDSLCEIAYIDNSAHFARHQHALGLYPTAEVTAPPKLERGEYYDIVYKNGARLRVFGDGHHQPIGDLPPNASAVIMLPGTERHQFTAQTLKIGANHVSLYNHPASDQLLSDLSSGKVPHPFGGYFTDSQHLMPRWRFMYPTEYTSVSDSDQMDRAVTNLRLFHTRSNPHLRVMLKRPREEKLPFSRDMLENPQLDSYLEAGVAVVWMLLKVKLKSGRELYIPLNLNKENERSFGGDIWKYIDEKRPLEIAAGRLRIPYRAEAAKDPAFRKMRSKIEEVPVPLEMLDLVGEIEEGGIKIDPVRYGETGGPIPVVDYLFVRRNSAGKVTDKNRAKEMSDRVAQLLISGNTALLREEEIERVGLIIGEDRARQNYLWTDKSGLVHLKMAREEYEELKPWIPAWYGKRDPAYSERTGELTIDVRHFAALCEQAYQEFSYRRFMPDDRYRNFFDSTETE